MVDSGSGISWWVAAMALVGFAKFTLSIWNQSPFELATETSEDARCPRCALVMHFAETRIDDEGYTPDHLYCAGCLDLAYNADMQVIGSLGS